MKKIDSVAVANETSTCKKQLEVCAVAGLLVETFQALEKKNPTVKEVKEKSGEQLYYKFLEAIVTVYALNLLASSHNSKEFNEIFERCQLDEEINA